MSTPDPSTSSSSRRPHRLPAAALALSIALSGAVAGIATAGPAAAGDTTSTYGTLSAPDATLPLNNKCGSYSYAVSVTPPAGTWAVEATVTDPQGRAMASGTLLEGYNATGPTTTLTYQLCTNNTTSGTFTLSAIFSVDDGTGTVTRTQMAPAQFQMTRAVKVRHTHQHNKNQAKSKHHKKKHRNRG
jgi:hypothetical protein